MKRLEELYKQDTRLVSSWKEKYTDREFYKLHAKITQQLNSLINGKELTGRDHFISAVIYHHSFSISSSKKALRHIKEAQKNGYNRQKWLLASITDRLLQLQGKPQKYGTQVVELKNGKCRQYKTDNSISDEERVSLGLPKLKELKKYIEK